MSFDNIVELFGSHGVDVEAACKLNDNQREKAKTPLDRALKAGHTETAGLLREFIELSGRPQAERDRILRPRAQFIDAVIDGNADTVRKLLDQDPMLLQRKIVTSLSNYAAEKGYQVVTDVLAE